MKILIDRFEGAYAVCESLDSPLAQPALLNIPMSQLPPTARTGHILVGNLGDSFTLDSQATAARSQRIGQKMDQLWN